MAKRKNAGAIFDTTDTHDGKFGKVDGAEGTALVKKAKANGKQKTPLYVLDRLFIENLREEIAGEVFYTAVHNSWTTTEMTVAENLVNELFACENATQVSHVARGVVDRTGHHVVAVVSDVFNDKVMNDKVMNKLRDIRLRRYTTDRVSIPVLDWRGEVAEPIQRENVRESLTMALEREPSMV